MLGESASGQASQSRPTSPSSRCRNEALTVVDTVMKSGQCSG